MPSKSVLETKQAIVAQLKDKVANSVSGVVVDYKGITAEADTKLRKELREAGVEYTVVKNTLLKRAIEGTEIEGMSEVLEGTTALAVSHEDQIAPARILNKFAKDSDGKFVISPATWTVRSCLRQRSLQSQISRARKVLFRCCLAFSYPARVVLLLHLVKLQRLRKLHKFAG